MNPEEPLPLADSAPKTLAVPGNGARSLAAIVFTDTVNFSSMMSRDEDRAMRLVARDLQFMRTVCASYSGEVAKATGDGLLMVFSSAVQAVGCALEIQRDLREQRRTLPLSERLHHRIGLHLGDVFQQDGDVMGDGVNIAARLQAESEPDGVCLSGTVYDIVQNRVPFNVTRRKSRKLKNVGTIVTYQIFPANSGNRYFEKALRFVGRRKRLLFLLLLFLIYFFWPSGHAARRNVMESVAREMGPFGPPIDSNLENEKAAPIDAPVKESSPARGSSQQVALMDFYLARLQNMEKYDYPAMTTWLQSNPTPDLPETRMVRICSALSGLDQWCTRQLNLYTSANPLYIDGGETETDDDDDPSTKAGSQDFEVWGLPNGGIVYRAHGHTSTLSREQIPPLIWAQIAATLLRQNKPPDDLTSSQLKRDLDYFQYVYGIKD
jgi:class 3 adenylate cyclase